MMYTACTARGLSSGWFLVGPAKVKAHKSILFCRGTVILSYLVRCIISFNAGSGKVL